MFLKYFDFYTDKTISASYSSFQLIAPWLHIHQSRCITQLGYIDSKNGWSGE